MSDDELLRLYHGDNQHGHIRMAGAHGDGLRRVAEKSRHDALEEAAVQVMSDSNFFIDGPEIAEVIRSLIPATVTPTESNPTPKENEL